MSISPRTAIYPGTFDPMTNGHLNVLQRAGDLFDLVIVSIADNSYKSPQLTIDQRLDLIESVITDIPGNFAVKSFSGLLVDFAKQQKVKWILRGLRTAVDFDYEFHLSGMNQCLNHQLDTVFLCADAHTSFISSSMVRDVLTHGGDISQFVPPQVLQKYSTLDK
jgi:pantetheine-phosphate adenylyltransferase